MKFSVSTYSFSQLMSDGMTQLDCVKKAKEMGFDAIDFSELNAAEGETLEQYAKRVAAECERNDIPVACVTVAGNLLKQGKELDEEIATIKRKIDAAAILGAGVFRHDAAQGDGRPFDTVLPIIADGCRHIAEYAQTLGVKTTVENHGFFCQDSYRMEKLYAAVSHPNFGLLSDMGNFLCADEDPARAIGITAPFTVYVHAKDFHVKSAEGPNPGRGFFRSRSGNYLRGAIIGQGNVPVKQCIQALKKAGYDGYISIEFEGMENPVTAIEIGLENLKNYVLTD